MKKIILFASTVVLFMFTACQKDNLNADLSAGETTQALTAIESSEVNLSDEAMIELMDPDALLKRKKVKIEDLLPTIHSYLKDNYPGAKIVDAYTDETGSFSVIIKDAEGKAKIVIFDKNGTFLKEGTLPDKGGLGKGDSIVKKIRTYINANYPGTGIGHIQRNKDGSYNVAVKSKDGKVVVLNFDKNGNFVKIVTTNNGGMDSTAVSNIKRYLNFAYPGSSYGAIERGKDGGYSVVVKSKDGKVTIVYFDKDGKFVKAVAPTTGTGAGNNTDSIAVFNIKQYLTKTYPDSNFGNIEKGKDGGFSVIVKSKDGKVTTVYFDKNGKFIKAVPQTTGGGGTGTLDPTVVSAIKGYLAEHYAGASFSEINRTNDGYFVIVKTANGKVYTVYFNKDGKFVKVTP